MSETIEERYEKAKEVMEGDIAELFIIHLLDDLMAEREKLISRVEELEELYYHPYPED